MSQEINFVSARHKRFNKNRQQDVFILKIVAGVVGLVAVVAVTSVAARAWFANRLDRLESDVAQAKQAILLNEDAEESYILLISKLTTLTEILQLRQDKQDALDYFTQVFGGDVLVKQIEYDDQARILSLRLQSPDVFILENIFDILDSAEVVADYPGVSKGDLRRTDTGQYELSLAIQLDNQNQPETGAEGEFDPLQQEVPPL